MNVEHSIADCGMRNKPKTDLTVEHCVNWLKAQGFEVLAVQIGCRNPRITIETSPLCEQLEGAVRMYSRSPEGERRYYVAIRFGCEIRWEEKANADCGMRNADPSTSSGRTDGIRKGTGNET